jgi:hypothetical protein
MTGRDQVPWGLRHQPQAFMADIHLSFDQSSRQYIHALVCFRTNSSSLLRQIFGRYEGITLHEPRMTLDKPISRMQRNKARARSTSNDTYPRRRCLCKIAIARYSSLAYCNSPRSSIKCFDLYHEVFSGLWRHNQGQSFDNHES